MADDGDVLQTGQALLGLLEGLRRDVDQVHARAAAGGLQRLGEHDQLLPAAASELDDCRPVRRAEGRNHVRGVAAQQPALGPRDSIPRQPADGVEQAGAERVVQVFRLELLRLEGEIAPHVRGELGGGGEGGRNDHVSCSTRDCGFRIPVYSTVLNAA
jgi:hypothetical protein